MKDLIPDTQDPVWQCWLKHVAHLSFCVRHVFTHEDRHELDRLYADFLIAFENVSQWQDQGFEKPKFHPGIHLGDVLEEFGPFRAYWCPPWEAFLQPLKRMFLMTNWKSAPYDAAVNWATKSVMHYRDPSRCAWHEDVVNATTEFAPLTSVPHSPIVRALQTMPGQQPYAVRFLCSFNRGPDEVRNGDWLFMQQAGDCEAIVGVVEQMLQATFLHQGFSVVRLWCAQCKKVHLDELGRIIAAPGEWCIPYAHAGDVRAHASEGCFAYSVDRA